MNEIEVALAEVKNKSKLCRVIAKEFKMQSTSVKQNWIYGGSIPKEHEKQVLRIINKHNKTEKALAS